MSDDQTILICVATITAVFLSAKILIGILQDRRKERTHTRCKGCKGSGKMWLAGWDPYTDTDCCVCGGKGWIPKEEGGDARGTKSSLSNSDQGWRVGKVSRLWGQKVVAWALLWGSHSKKM